MSDAEALKQVSPTNTWTRVAADMMKEKERKMRELTSSLAKKEKTTVGQTQNYTNQVSDTTNSTNAGSNQSDQTSIRSVPFDPDNKYDYAFDRVRREKTFWHNGKQYFKHNGNTYEATNTIPNPGRLIPPEIAARIDNNRLLDYEHDGRSAANEFGRGLFNTDKPSDEKMWKAPVSRKLGRIIGGMSHTLDPEGWNDVANVLSKVSAGTQLTDREKWLLSYNVGRFGIGIAGGWIMKK